MRVWKIFLIMAVGLLMVLFGSLSGLTGEGQNTSGKKVLTVRELPDFRISKAKVLYNRYCVFCHGDTGGGDGLNAYSIPVKPRNFNERTVLARKTDEELARVILSGGNSQGLSKYMPAFDRTLSTDQVGHLVAFIREELGNNE